MPSLDLIDAHIQQAMPAQRHRFRNRLRALRSQARGGKPTAEAIEALERDVNRSVTLLDARRRNAPSVHFDVELPVAARREEIAAAIRDHQVVIVCGETGSGKSTQIPKICLELGRGIDRLIGHTQPRRIAARSIAARIAEELRSPLGKAVGYKVRFTDATSPHTYIKLMTDGILLAETQEDRFLDQYDTIILDEAHERSLNIDFLIGYLKGLLPKRRNLKLIITSATIDAGRFAAHFVHGDCPNCRGGNDVGLSEDVHRRENVPIPFGRKGTGTFFGLGASTPCETHTGRKTSQSPADASAAVGEDRLGPAAVLPAPVIEVSGRTYPVEVRYRPIEPDAETGDTDVQQAVLEAVHELASIDDGDMLIFMPTERDIHETAKARGRTIPGDSPDRQTEILPLYARLSAKDQERVFHPGQNRRIVIATNVAESSLTVPRIRFVIDPGTAHQPLLGAHEDPAVADRADLAGLGRSRKGRCGRLGPGICVRLFSEEDYLSRERFTPPEILRTNLAWVILQTKALRLGDIERFAFLDPPRADSIRDGYRTLFELGAINEDDHLTDVGRRLARIPVDPRIGRMILAAELEGCLDEVLVIASALEIQDPRERPRDKQEQADACHSRFADPDSDFLGYLKLWDFFHDLKATLSRNQLSKACRQHYLSFNRMREWLDLHRQLLQLVERAGVSGRPADPRVGSSASGCDTNPKRQRGPDTNPKRQRGPDTNPKRQRGPSLALRVGVTAASAGNGTNDKDEPPDGGTPTDVCGARVDYAAVHRAILAGLLSNVGFRTGANEYSVPGGQVFYLWPGSALFAKRPTWLVAAELVETTRRYLRTCADQLKVG